MKIHLDISKDSYEEIKEMFESKGFEISSDGEYVLRENRVDESHIYVRKENGDREVIPIEKILYVKSFRHQLVITTEDGVYTSAETLYRMEQIKPGLLSFSSPLLRSACAVLPKMGAKKAANLFQDLLLVGRCGGRRVFNLCIYR